MRKPRVQKPGIAAVAACAAARAECRDVTYQTLGCGDGRPSPDVEFSAGACGPNQSLQRTGRATHAPGGHADSAARAGR